MKDIWLKILSVIAAILVWFMIFNVSDAVINAKQTLKVNVINAESLNQANLYYELDDNSKVTVSYKVRANEAASIKDSDFNVYIDLKELSLTGAVPVHVDVLNSKDSVISDLKLNKPVINIKTEEIKSKDFTITVNTSGQPEKGYTVASIELDNPTVTVTGPESQIGRINAISVDIDIDRLNGDKTGIKQINVLDGNGKKLNLENVKLSLSEVNCNVLVNETKEVEIRLGGTGIPLDGMIFTSISLYPSKVTISGRPEVLNKIEYLDLGNLDVTGRDASYTEVIDLNNYIPAGVELKSTNVINAHINISKVTIDLPDKTEESNEELRFEPSTNAESSTEQSTEQGGPGTGMTEAESSSTESSSSESMEEKLN